MNPLRAPRHRLPARPGLLVCLLLAAAAGLAAPRGAAAEAATLPFGDGEKLTYQIRWLGIPIATTRLNVEGPLPWKGGQVFRYRLRLRSIGLLHRLYPVRDWAESLADAETLASRRMDLHQREGFRYRSHKWFVFERGRVLYGRPDRELVPYEAPDDVLDALAALYRIRAKALRPGDEAEFGVFDRRRTRQVRVRVTQAEWLDSLWGPLRTLRVEPEFLNDDALNRRGRAWIWVTADEGRVPVRIESRTFAGSLVAHLVETGGLRSGPLAAPPAKALSAWQPSTRVVREDSSELRENLKKLLDKEQQPTKK